jgi:hypothetical protein
MQRYRVGNICTPNDWHCTMTNNHKSIDDHTGFSELGVPSPLQAYKQQQAMLVDELDDAWREIRESKQTITKLVAMNDKLANQLAVLKFEHEKVRWQLSDMNLKAGLEAGRRLRPGDNIHQGDRSMK